VLGVSLGTIQSRVHDGIKRLRELLADGAGVSVPLMVLDRHLQDWHNVPAPPSLATRVYEAIGRDASSPSQAGSAARSLPVGAPAGLLPDSSILLRAGTVAGLMAIVAAGGMAWVKYGPQSPAAVRAINPVLQVLSQVRSAHATGTYEYRAVSREERSTPRRLAVEFWFKLPGRYRQQMRAVGTQSATGMYDLVADGGRGRLLSHNGQSGTTSLVATPDMVYRRLAPFSLFTQDGALPSAIREGSARVTHLNGEYQNRAAQIYTVDYAGRNFTCRWTLYVDPEVRRVMQVDYVERRANDPNGLPALTATLSNFEYNIGVQDKLFAAQNPQTSPAHQWPGEVKTAASN
jgi:outer membrane lipoprotein-sorting protein